MEDTRGFLDKAKAAMGQAAERAKDELEELQARRDLGQAQRDLGKLAFELIEEGELDHPRLEEPAARIRELTARLEAGEEPADVREGEEPAAEPEPAEPGDPDEA
jgi:cob(I)alamin adenosyltransferase